MDDVDYLVEDNTGKDFCLSSEMDGTHGRTTLEGDPKQQLLRGKPIEIGTMAVQAGNKSRCWECSNHHICLRFRSGWCQDIPDSSSLDRKK